MTTNRIEQMDDIMQSVFVEIVKMHDDHRFKSTFAKNMSQNQFNNISVEREEVDRYGPNVILVKFDTLDWNFRPISFAGRISRGVFWSTTVNGRGYTGGELASVMTNQQWEGFVDYSKVMLNAIKAVVDRTTKEVVSEDFNFVSRKP